MIKSPTITPKAEAVLWAGLKGADLLGYKFSREYGVGELVVDFYCRRLRLVVEIEGSQSLKRQAIIEAYGIRFLSFTDSDVHGDMDGVMQKITSAIATAQGN